LNLWLAAAGVGLFLFGMRNLEAALRALVGPSMKRILRRMTDGTLRSVFIGTLATLLMQSSSLVGLTVLAFVGAGVLTLASGLGLVFGANLGTTFTGWLVTLVGFKLDFDQLALPILAVGTLGVSLTKESRGVNHWSRLLTGFGLLLLGLSFMKDSTAAATEVVNPADLAALPLLAFLAFGIVLAAVVQSSSAVVTITLSSLYAGFITLPAGAAIVIGADLGTTVTVIIGALGGAPIKRQVAAGHVIFNLVSDSIAFFVLLPFLVPASDWLGLTDPLITLVLFHTTFNVVGLLLFMPFLGIFAALLERRFRRRVVPETRYIESTPPGLQDVAVENLERETRRLVDQAIAFNVAAFDLAPRYSFYDSEDDRRNTPAFEPTTPLAERYQSLKRLEGAILRFSVRLQRESLDEAEANQVRHILIATRNAVQSSKSMKDVRHNIEWLRDNDNDYLHVFYDQFRAATDLFYKSLDSMRSITVSEVRDELITDLEQQAMRTHEELHKSIYAEIARTDIAELELSTLLNVNRESFNAALSILAALRDLFSDGRKAESGGAGVATPAIEAIG
jgi:phosphate:Na+ symporter